MSRLCVLVCGLFLCLGCAGEGDKAQWDEVWKDARGDNMKMTADRAPKPSPVSDN